MPRVNLTAAFCNHVDVTDGKQHVFWDTKVTGFGLRVSPGGSRQWICAYHTKDKMVWSPLGALWDKPLVQARREAARMLARVHNGEPARPEVAPAAPTAAPPVVPITGPTFGELASMYIERHAKEHKRSWAEDVRIIRHDLLPVWGDRVAASIKRPDVVKLLDVIVDRGAGIMANHVHSLVSKIFSFAINRGALDQDQINPVLGLNKPARKLSRDRVLTKDEIRTVWGALDVTSGHRFFAPIFKLSLLTGQREGEVMGLTWSELDLENAVWELPGERTKNRHPNSVPLGPTALSILCAQWDAPHDSVVCFPGHILGRPLTDLAKPMRVIREHCKVNFWFHDLRRTMRSGLAELGVSRPVAEKLLNHHDGSVAGVYDRYDYAVEKRKALVEWDQHVASIVA